MSPRGLKNVAKFERPSTVQHRFYSDVLQSQQTDFNGVLADTVLICDGGTVRIHAFLLQAASPLFQKAIFSQGENYPYVREILLPDFSVKEITRMLNLVYKGYTILKTQKDVQNLKETLNFFQISNVNFKCDEQWEKIQGSLKVQDLNRIPQDIFKKETENPEVVAVVVKQNNTNPSNSLRRSTRPSKPVLQPPDKSNDDNYKTESSDESSDESGDENRKRPRRGRPAATKPIIIQPASVRITRVENPVVVKPPSSSVITVTKVQVKSPTKSLTPAIPENESSTDTEDEGWVQPDFKDDTWFARESRKCQTCNKDFDKPSEASLCITSHKSLRCYFCFRVFTTTDKLFKHFRRRHKPAGRDSTLVCPFCDQGVPFKSVSCHVISVHLRNKSADDKDRSRASSVQSIHEYKPGEARVGRPPSSISIISSVSTVSTASKRSSITTDDEGKKRGPPKKRLKTDSENGVGKKKLKLPTLKKQKSQEGTEEKLRVPDLDLTLEKVTARGTLVFRLQKLRPADSKNGDTGT